MKTDNTKGRPTPKLIKEMVKALETLSREEWLDLRQCPDAECGILIRDADEAATVSMLFGLDHAGREADRQLQLARVAEGRWKAMKLDLLEMPRGACVWPIDYCPEISPEDATILKDATRLDEAGKLPCYDMTLKLADMLCLGDGGEFFFDYDLDHVEASIRLLGRKVAGLTRSRETLRRALPQTWPGTTQAEWSAYRAAQKTAAITLPSQRG